MSDAYLELLLYEISDKPGPTLDFPLTILMKTNQYFCFAKHIYTFI